MSSVLKAGALGAAALLLFVLTGPALGQTPPPPPGGARVDKLAEIRPEVKRLEAEGAYERALMLLRGILEASLDVAARLERTQRIDELLAKQLTRYTDDRAKAHDLEAKGKHAEAIAALDKVAVYGNEKQIADAREEQTRLKGAGEKAAVDAKAKEEADRKKREADAIVDAKASRAAVGKWLNARKQLLCSKCKGEKVIMCSTCGGNGQIKVISATPGPGTGAQVRYEPCKKCQASGKVRCTPDNCGGRGFSTYKLEDVLWDVWPPAFQQQVDEGCGSRKRYIDLMIAKFNGENVANDLLDACYGTVGSAIEPIRGWEALDTTMGADGVVKAKYRVKRRGDVDEWEETRWRKIDGGGWFVVPPEIGGAKDPGKPATLPPPKRP